MAPTIQKMLNDISQGLSTASDTALLDAQVLLAHFLGKPRSWLLAHPEARLERTVQADIQQAFLRLQQGEPLPYVIGHWEFFGLDFLLTHHVLIPRPETELLVERALAWLNKHPGCTRVADVGTGSGCIGIALAMHHPSIRLLMTDISPQALEVAQENARRYAISGRMDFQQADLLDGITSLY
ncbi:MAG: N5-glutamine methyltransferase family protein, partial [Acidobacteriaceae bacterium]